MDSLPSLLDNSQPENYILAGSAANTKYVNELSKSTQLLDVRLNPSGTSIYSGLIVPGKVCQPNTAGSQIHEDVFPFLRAHHARITKAHYFAFTKITIHSDLQQANTKHFFPVGVTTKTSISATAIEACKLGYEVTTVEDSPKAFQPENLDQASNALSCPKAA